MFTLHIGLCVLAGRWVSLRVALIKLILEDAEQAGDAVIQPHIQNELQDGKKTTCLRL